MSAATERLVASFTSRGHDVLRVEAGVRRNVTTMLRKMERDLTGVLASGDPTEPTRTAYQRARVEALVQQARESVLIPGYNGIARANQRYLNTMAQTEVPFVRRAVAGAYGFDLMTVAPGAAVMDQLARNTLVHGAPSAEWWRTQRDATSKRFVTQMRQGTLRGETINDLMDRVRGQPQRDADGKVIRGAPRVGGIMDVSKSQAEALVRSSGQAVMNSARMATYRANADVISGVRAVVTFDTRTTEVCIARAEGAWDLETGDPLPEDGSGIDFPGEPPWHWNCRTTLVPVMRTFADMTENQDLGERMDAQLAALPVGTRQAMDGAVPRGTTYEGWLSQQSVSDQQSVLGVGKWELWQRGDLNLSDLADETGRPRPLSDLVPAGESVADIVAAAQARTDGEGFAAVPPPTGFIEDMAFVDDPANLDPSVREAFSGDGWPLTRDALTNPALDNAEAELRDAFPVDAIAARADDDVMFDFINREGLGPCGPASVATTEYLRAAGVDAHRYGFQFTYDPDGSSDPLQHYASVVMRDGVPVAIVDFTNHQFDEKLPAVITPNHEEWAMYRDPVRIDGRGPDDSLWAKENFDEWRSHLNPEAATRGAAVAELMARDTTEPAGAIFEGAFAQAFSFDLAAQAYFNVRQTFPEDLMVTVNGVERQQFVYEDGKDARDHLMQLDLLPTHLLEHAQRNGVNINIGNRGVGEWEQNAILHGVTPRGWDPGDSWDNVMAAYDPVTRTMFAGSGRGSSASPVLHEFGHAVQDLIDPAQQDRWNAIYENQLNIHREQLAVRGQLGLTDHPMYSEPYFTQPYPGGQQETFAESFAELHAFGVEQATSFWGKDPVRFLSNLDHGIRLGFGRGGSEKGK